MKTVQDLVADAKTRIREISVADVQHLVAEGSDAVLVDIREGSEWNGGHIPGAVHIARGVLELKLPQGMPDPDAPIVLYCGGGNRSALAADVLQTMGYRDVTSMAGGWRGWLGAGGPVMRDEE